MEQPIIPWRDDGMKWGVSTTKPVASRRNTTFQEVLVERVQLEKDAGWKNASQEKIIFNMVLYPSTHTRVVSAQMRKRYEQLNKEKKHGTKKYIDGIKSH